MSVQPLGKTQMAPDAWAGPVTMHPDDEQPLESWIADHRALINDEIATRGAVLFSGFRIDTPARFREVSAVLCGEMLDYVYRSTPRTSVEKQVYTATEYPAHSTIPFHNENAYQRDWPMTLVFGCLQPAATGGETPLASSVNVTKRIDPAVIAHFAEKGVMYVRNYGHGIDLPWEVTFQTDSKADVEAYCRRASIEWEWLPDNRLRTRQTCQAVANHPVTGERLWFNQAHLFHVSSLGPEDQEMMLGLLGEADLPRHAYFGDGTPLDQAALDHVRAAFDAEAYVSPWARGDVLLLDNMLVAHARKPYTGARQVLVAMGDPFSQANVNGRQIARAMSA